jgi:cation transport regulator
LSHAKPIRSGIRLKAFNNAYEEYHHDEHRAFAVAHHAAKQAGERPGPG